MTTTTPGPWEACRDTTEEHGRIIKDAAGEHLAAIPYWGDHQYEMNANARLITAAPDLLEVAALVDAWGHGLRHPTAHESRMVTTARAALAKARG